MIFVTGPLFAGKKEYVCQALGWSEEDLSAKAAWMCRTWRSKPKT